MEHPNYESIWWGMIYDQMMAEQQELLDAHRRFYQSQLRDLAGPALECACGTGLVLLPLLAQGHDMYGFDASRPMLATLERKAAAQGADDIARRISVQRLEAFHYAQRFAAILIPSNSFSMLATQEAQLEALRRIHAHLAPGGKLLLDLRLIGLGDLPGQAIQGRWHTWAHAETGRPIRQRVTGAIDYDRQLIVDHCEIEYDGQRAEFPMVGRLILRDELALLLRLAGFSRWKAFSTPEGTPLVVGPHDQHSYWVIESEEDR